MNILITGGSKGIGLETAKVLSSDKANLIMITGRNEESLKNASHSASHENIVYLKADIAQLHAESGRIFKEVSGIFSTLDILINNAGYLFPGTFETLSEKEIRMMMEVNYFGAAILIRLLLPLMHKGSHIVNISSMGGFQGSSKFPGLSGYSASKAAIASLTECLAVEFAEKEISVICLAPGSVQTEMFNEAFPGYRANLSPGEMGEFIAWFAVNGNRFFNGKILPVAFSTP